MNMTFYKNIFRSINRFLHPAGCVPWTFGCLWGLVCVRDGGCRDNKSLCINWKKKIAKPLAPQKHSKNRQLYHWTDNDSYLNNNWRINISLSASSKCFEDGNFTYSVEVKACWKYFEWTKKQYWILLLYSIKNYALLGCCYLPLPLASANITFLNLHNSSYHTWHGAIIFN